jgi:hypothetical protein
MRRWLLPGLLLLALGCGRKEDSQPEAVVQVLPAAIEEPNVVQEPEPVQEPPAPIQPVVVPDTVDARKEDRIVRFAGKGHEFIRLPPTGIPTDPWWKSDDDSRHELSGYEVERVGGIFQAVKTLPGVSGW